MIIYFVKKGVLIGGGGYMDRIVDSLITFQKSRVCHWKIFPTDVTFRKINSDQLKFQYLF